MALRFIDGQLANRYLHGPAIDQILADEQVESLSSPGEVLWPLTDHLGTVRDLAVYDDATSTTSIVNHIAYDAFGRVTSQSNAAIDHLFGYTGREWDSSVDLQYNRARWYDPSIGRWLSEDPIGFAAGDANLNRYVGNQATLTGDPSGLKPPPGSLDELDFDLLGEIEQPPEGKGQQVFCDPFQIFSDIAEGIFSNYEDEFAPSGEDLIQWIHDNPWTATGAGIAIGTATGIAINEGLLDSIEIPDFDLTDDLSLSGHFNWSEETLDLKQAKVA